MQVQGGSRARGAGSEAVDALILYDLCVQVEGGGGEQAQQMRSSWVALYTRSCCRPAGGCWLNAGAKAKEGPQQKKGKGEETH